MAKVSKHESILTAEIINLLQVQPGGCYADATFGGGGHSQAILRASAPTGTVLAFDRDPSVADFAAELEATEPKRFSFVADSYQALAEYPDHFDGIVFDLGFSSDQLETSGRGFSFQHQDEPLDLRFNPLSGQTAAQFLSQAPLPKIEQVFREYAEDRYWRKLSAQIVGHRRTQPIRTVKDFISYVGTENPKVLAPLFQALRIEVNQELQVLQHGLAAAATALRSNGRVAVITFHSLEDRIVKECFRTMPFTPVVKKPVLPGAAELAANPRSRSAKLRVASKV